jgi:hypothetical protein
MSLASPWWWVHWSDVLFVAVATGLALVVARQMARVEALETPDRPSRFKLAILIAVLVIGAALQLLPDGSNFLGRAAPIASLLFNFGVLMLATVLVAARLRKEREEEAVLRGKRDQELAGATRVVRWYGGGQLTQEDSGDLHAAPQAGEHSSHDSPVPPPVRGPREAP